jgi:hypothetical protein
LGKGPGAAEVDATAAEETGDDAEHADGDGCDADRAGDAEGDVSVCFAGGPGVRSGGRGGDDEQGRRQGCQDSRPGK